MRKLFTIATLCILGSIAHAAPLTGSIYAGGTLASPAPGASVSLELSQPVALQLITSSSTVAIPWSSITAWGCYRRNTHRLGVLPTIAAGLVAARLHTHYLSLVWNDSENHSQAIVIQIPGDLPNTLHVVLEARTPAQTHNIVPKNTVQE